MDICYSHVSHHYHMYVFSALCYGTNSGGGLLFLRHWLSYIPSLNTMDVSNNKSTEWLRGEKLCTFKTKTMWHLGWSVPMADPSYYVMGAGIHSFLMFAPFFALYDKKGMIIQGLFLFLTGPAMAAWISPNLMEQASIWCFFSIAQVTSMLFLIRETLITHWGTEGSGKAISVMTKTDKSAPATECREFKGKCEHCGLGKAVKRDN